MILFIDRILSYIQRKYRNKVFLKKTGYRAQLVGKITLINRNITVGKRVVIYPDCMFFGDGPIIIGDNVNIGNGTIIYASKDAGVKIGSNTMIGAYTYIIDTDHGIKEGQLICNQCNTTEKVIIGEDCWFGTGVKVLKGSFVEMGAVIGAGALVKGHIPSNAVAVGIPAKVIKYRR